MTSPRAVPQPQKRTLVARTLGLAVCLLALFSPTSARAQTASLIGSEESTSLPDAPQTLQIIIIDGDEALNNIRDRTAREPIVQVEDENHKPVAGALVLFTLHTGAGGAGGSFGGLTSLSVTTGADGRAIAHGLKPNTVTGQYTITVTATAGAVVAEVTIHQSNLAGPAESTPNPTNTTVNTIKHVSSKRSWLIASGAIAAAVVVVVLGTHIAATTISAGAGSVGH